MSDEKRYHWWTAETRADKWVRAGVFAIVAYIVVVVVVCTVLHLAGYLR